MVVLARGPACSVAGISDPCKRLPNELARARRDFRHRRDSACFLFSLMTVLAGSSAAYTGDQMSTRPAVTILLQLASHDLPYFCALMNSLSIKRN